jgi:hypothetical protein
MDQPVGTDERRFSKRPYNSESQALRALGRELAGE